MNLKKHWKIFNGLIFRRFECSHCPCEFSTTSEFDEHTCSTERMNTQCSVCKKEFESRFSFIEHFKEEHVRGDLCLFCYIKYSTDEKLLEHWNGHGMTMYPVTARRMLSIDGPNETDTQQLTRPIVVTGVGDRLEVMKTVNRIVNKVVKTVEEEEKREVEVSEEELERREKASGVIHNQFDALFALLKEQIRFEETAVALQKIIEDDHERLKTNSQRMNGKTIKNERSSPTLPIEVGEYDGEQFKGRKRVLEDAWIEAGSKRGRMEVSDLVAPSPPLSYCEQSDVINRSSFDGPVESTTTSMLVPPPIVVTHLPHRSDTSWQQSVHIEGDKVDDGLLTPIVDRVGEGTEGCVSSFSLSTPPPSAPISTTTPPEDNSSPAALFSSLPLQSSQSLPRVPMNALILKDTSVITDFTESLQLNPLPTIISQRVASDADEDESMQQRQSDGEETTVREEIVDEVEDELSSSKSFLPPPDVPSSSSYNTSLPIDTHETSTSDVADEEELDDVIDEEVTVDDATSLLPSTSHLEEPTSVVADRIREVTPAPSIGSVMGEDPEKQPVAERMSEIAPAPAVSAIIPQLRRSPRKNGNTTESEKNKSNIALLTPVNPSTTAHIKIEEIETHESPSTAEKNEILPVSVADIIPQFRRSPRKNDKIIKEEPVDETPNDGSTQLRRRSHRISPMKDVVKQEGNYLNTDDKEHSNENWNEELDWKDVKMSRPRRSVVKSEPVEDDDVIDIDKDFWTGKSTSSHCPKCDEKVGNSTTARKVHFKKFHYASFFSAVMKMNDVERWVSCRIGDENAKDSRVCLFCGGNESLHEGRVALLRHIKKDHREDFIKMKTAYRLYSRTRRMQDIAVDRILN